MGPAGAYAESFSGVTKPEFMTGKSSKPRPFNIWIFCPSLVLWQSIDFQRWAVNVGDVTKKELISLSNRLYARASYWATFEDGGAEAIRLRKAWISCHGVAQRALGRLNWQTIQNIAEAAAVKMRDDDFLPTLDAARNLMSFSNGVVDLATGTMRDRQPEDRLTYVLPYLFDSAADQSDIKAFVHQLFDDADAERAFQVYAGYVSTGSTEQKMFLQLSSRPHSGKSTLLDVLSRAMGSYCSYATVPIEELSSAGCFEGTLADQLARLPPTRFLALDETTKGVHLNESVVNQMTSGLSDISLTLRVKHISGVRSSRFHAKLAFSSNHVLSIPSSSAGTAARVRGPPFKYHFVPALSYDAATSPEDARPSDDALIARLKSPDGRAGVAAYLVEGARMYYASGIPASSAWDAKTFQLRSDGDVFIKWIACNYTPTGSPAHKTPLSVLIEQYAATNKHARDIEEGMRSALVSMSAFVTFVEWEESAPFYNVSSPPVGHPRVRVVGVSGLVVRMVSHEKFAVCIPAATLAATDARQAIRAI